MLAQSQRISQLCILTDGEMDGARQLSGMLYGTLAQPSKGQPDAVEGCKPLVCLQTPGSAAGSMPSLHLHVYSSGFLSLF